MDRVLINRIGLILDLLASFMLAPELIGLDRIKKWEDALERMVSSGLMWLRGAVPTGPRKDRAQWVVEQIVIGGSIFLLSFQFWFVTWYLTRDLFWDVSTLHYVVLIVLFVALNIAAMVFYFKVFVPNLGRFGYLGTLIIVVVISIITGLTQILRWLILLCLLCLLTFARRMLEGQDRLRAMIVAVGIFALIVGFLLQLLATF